MFDKKYFKLYNFMENKSKITFIIFISIFFMSSCEKDNNIEELSIKLEHQNIKNINNLYLDIENYYLTDYYNKNINKLLANKSVSKNYDYQNIKNNIDSIQKKRQVFLQLNQIINSYYGLETENTISDKNNFNDNINIFTALLEELTENDTLIKHISTVKSFLRASNYSQEKAMYNIYNITEIFWKLEINKYQNLLANDYNIFNNNINRINPENLNSEYLRKLTNLPLESSQNLVQAYKIQLQDSISKKIISLEINMQNILIIIKSFKKIYSLKSKIYQDSYKISKELNNVILIQDKQYNIIEEKDKI